MYNKRWQFRRKVPLFVLLLLILLGNLVWLRQGTQPAVAAPLDTSPDFMHSHPDIVGLIADDDSWITGGGYLYWARCNSTPAISAADGSTTAITNTVNAAATTDATGYLRRWPTSGGRAVTLSADAFCTKDNWSADDSGLYYWSNGYIVRRSQGNPLNEVRVAGTLQPQGKLAFDSSYIYWIIGSNNYIYRTPKNQPDPDDPRYTDVVGYAGANAHDLILGDDNNLYWIGDGIIYSFAKSCLEDCTRTTIANEAGVSLINAHQGSVSFDTNVYPLWVLGQSIRGYWCRFVLPGGRQCSPSNTYTAPTVNDQIWRPGQLTTDGTYLFWIENFQNCSGSFCVDSPQGQLMKWKLRPRLLDTDPFVDPQPIAAQNTGGATFNIRGTQVGVANAFVYFNTTQGVTRIRSDALPAQAVIVPGNWEVTQAIQNFSNDVPLVANKPTYARVFATKVSGPRSNAVLAKVDAFGGAAQDQYVGTIYPINGALNFPINVANTYNRANRDDGWLFQLPDNWTNAGKIKLQVSVNGNSNYQIPTFTSKAPVCVVAIKVRTNGPTASDAGPNYAAAVGMVRRLYPASGVWTYHQDDDIAKLVIKWGGPFDLIPYPGYGPYSIPENQTRIFTSLVERDLFSDDPDECDNAGARTHYIGIVSPETNTTNSSGGTANGAGRLDYDQLWVKLPPQNIDPSNLTATRIATLGHELGHNYNREHVDCGGPNPDEGLDGGYPYDKCMLDQRDQSAFTTYFGFDAWTQKPITPDSAGDLMSYAQNLSPAKPRWISDYTWRALNGAISQDVTVNATVNAAAANSASAVAFAQAQTVVYVSGSYTSTGGILDYAWGYPSVALSNKVHQKWQNALALTTAEATAASLNAGLHLRLLAANGAVLDDRAVPELDAHGDVTTDEHAFAFTFPAPIGQVAKVELLSGELVLADLHPGPSAPVVTILQPAGGETIDQTMTLSWRATDADPDDHLLYAVQYSPDNGATWRALLTNLANPTGIEVTTVNLSQLSGIPGSLPNGARIRVAASDGYNTTLATSAPFTVVNRAPQPYILAPAPSQRYKAGEIVVVQGGADDAEDGGLSGAALTWTLDGVAVGTGTSVSMEGLAPKAYTLTLTAKDSTGAESSLDRSLIIAPLSIPSGVAPTLDGDCNDDAYAGAAHVSPQPYADGSRISIMFLQSGGSLYACFGQMKRAGGTSPGSLVVMRMDVNHSRDAQPQSDDYALTVGEDGVPQMWTGTGSTWSAITPVGLVGRVSTTGANWSAELQLDVNVFGGWNHVVGMDVEHAWVNAVGDDYYWPYSAIWHDPSSWATTVWGDAPQLTSLDPVSATVGSADLTLTINGVHFADGATAQWDRTVLSTTVLSDTQLTTVVPAALLSTPATVTVTVVNPGMADAPSNPLPFEMGNPMPTLTQVSLKNGVLTVSGADFVAGAQLIWNGLQQPTTMKNGGELQANEAVPTLPVDQIFTVAVFNPGPGGGVSNLMTVVIAAGASTQTLNEHIYLPLIAR